MSDVLILNGRLVDPASGVDAERDVLLRHGKVAAVEKPGGLKDVKAKEVIDAAGLVVAPGLVDVHVHLREPGRRTRSRLGRGLLLRRRWVYDCGGDAEYDSGERFGGGAGVDDGRGARGLHQAAGDACGYVWE
ncbi:MAG: hypothetical protein WDN23_18470 [Edaphobacter sp.]